MRDVFFSARQRPIQRRAVSQRGTASEQRLSVEQRPGAKVEWPDEALLRRAGRLQDLRGFPGGSSPEKGILWKGALPERCLSERPRGDSGAVACLSPSWD